MAYKEKTLEIYNQIQQGNLMQAFEENYHQDVVMTEPSGTREGKDACREYELKFLDMVQEFHGLEVNNIAEDENKATVFLETTMDVTFKDGNRVKMEQVAVQKWQDDKIIHERFYYQNA